jgi:hypothetical protein
MQILQSKNLRETKEHICTAREKVSPRQIFVGNLRQARILICPYNFCNIYTGHVFIQAA